MKKIKPKIIVICGPTSSGKSDLAVWLSKKINGEVISADSRQVYKGLDIGSGKITKKEMRGVPHYLLDVAVDKKKQNLFSRKLIMKLLVIFELRAFQEQDAAFFCYIGRELVNESSVGEKTAITYTAGDS